MEAGEQLQPLPKKVPRRGAVGTIGKGIGWALAALGLGGVASKGLEAIAGEKIDRELRARDANNTRRADEIRQRDLPPKAP